MKYLTCTYTVYCLLCLLSLTCGSCKAELTKFIPPADKHIAYMGRMNFTDTTTTMYWPGSSITVNTDGTDVAITLKDEKGNNYFYVIIDGKPIKKLNPDTVKRQYKIAENMKPGKHNITLYKLTEGTQGATTFYGLYVNNKARLYPKPAYKHTIEYYGNSITSGFGVDDRDRDNGAPQYFNHYYSYGALTARHFNAGFHCISKSGIGFMVSWFPIIMPEMYNRIAPADTLQKWNFTTYKPELVVIDLGQNDSWLIKKTGHEQFRARFGNMPPDSAYIVQAYINFVQTISMKYPDTYIICTLGSMDATKEGSPWVGYIAAAVKHINNSKVLYCMFPYKNTPGHPKRKEQAAMAEHLQQFIHEKLGW